MHIVDPWSHCLLEGEKVITKFDGIRLRNTNDDGILLVTNFRFLFVSKETKSELGTIPLTTVEQIKEQDVRSFEIIGHDMRVLVFDFKSEQKQELSKIVEYLTRCAKPSLLVDLFAFALDSTPPTVANRTSPNMRLLKEYQRLLHIWFPHSPSTRFEIQKSLENKLWRVTEVNSDYSLCSTYPSHLIVPRTISDEELQEMSTSRALSRLPVISWCDSGSGAVLARSSRPMGIKNLKKYADEKLVSALRTPGICRTYHIRKLYIVDAGPGVSAVGNMQNGGGSELASPYPESEIVYLGIENIYEMRVSLSSLRKYVDTHGSISSNVLPLAGSGTGDLGNHGSAWGVGTLNSMTKFSSILGEWLKHIESILVGGSWIAAKIVHESASVLVHCSDGWDRTTQLVGLASLLLDPYYRTFTGFQALVEKDWLAFGHQFAERMGLPTIAKGGRPANPSVKTQASDNKTSPVLLQWLECIAQLLRMYPSAFEFSTIFLIDFMYAVLSCRFGNFLCNSEWEREQAEVTSSCPCIWEYLADLRASGGICHEHRNPFYDPSKCNGPIVPPSLALAPTLWPEFYLRWVCPSESQGGGREREYMEAMKAKKDAESRFVELKRMLAELNTTVNSHVAKPSGRKNNTADHGLQCYDQV